MPPVLRSRTTLVVALSLLIPALAGAQAPPAPDIDPVRDGMFPDASFGLTFRKYTPSGNPFSPFYAWDGDMDLQATVFRRGVGAIDVRSVIQAIGTENFGATVGVGVSGYLLGAGYVHRYSEETTLSAGFTHVSSHLTRDLDRKLGEQRDKGIPIPVVRDTDQFNILFVKAQWQFPVVRFEPEIEVALQPVSLPFGGRPGAYVRPIYAATRWTLWQRGQASFVAETQHEIGENPFNRFSLSVELYARDQAEGRLQAFVNASPGRDFHVSPNVGAVRDGFAFGVRLKFRT